MKQRKLRIAWSMVWGVLAVLLVVLWVRSYRGSDVVYRQTTITRTVLFSRLPLLGGVPAAL